MTQDITAVELSRIAGYAYPNYDIEKKRLLLLFSSPQAISPGDVICATAASSANEFLLRYDETHIRDDYVLYYHVKEVTVENNGRAAECKEPFRGVTDSNLFLNDVLQPCLADSRLSRNSDKKIKSMTVTGKTRIVLKGRTNHAIISTNNLPEDGFDQGCEGDETDFGRGSCVNLSREMSENLLKDSIFTLYEIYSKILRFTVQKSCYLNVSSDSCSPVLKDIVGNSMNLDVLPLSVTDNTVFGLINSPLLLESTCGEEDMRAIVLGASRMLGICAVTIDARIIFESMAQTTSVECSSSFRQTFQNRDRPGFCNTADGSTIVQLYSPCMLFIENLDSLIFGGIAGDPNSQAQNEENEFQEVFAIILNKFLNSLSSAVADSTRSKHSAEGSKESTSCFKEHLANSCVLVSTVTRNLSRLKPALRALFPSEISLSPHPDIRVNQYVDDILKNLLSSNMDPKGIQETESHTIASTRTSNPSSVLHSDSNVMDKVKEQLLKAANSLSVEGGAGVSQSVLDGLFDEVVTYRLKKDNGRNWLRECGLAKRDKRRKSSLPSSPPSSSLSPPKVQGLNISEDDVKRVASLLGKSHISSDGSGSSGVKVSPVHWGDIGGLDAVRKEILNILQLPSLRPELFPAGCSRRRGILLYGPPGTGKTLVARAVATECDMAFISVKGPELLDVFVGESERNVREVFASAHRCAPCVLFFDELDSLAPARGRGSDGGGVMDRVVSQLLTEIDSLGSETSQASSFSKMTTGAASSAPAPTAAGVFIIGATNRPDLLDPALLRPGRFDRKIYLSVCKDVSARVQILKAQTRKFSLGEDVDLTEVAKFLPDTVTGADIGALSSSAYSKALERKLSQLRDQAGGEEKTKSNSKDGRNEIQGPESHTTDRTTPASSIKLTAYINSLSNSDLMVSVSMSDFLFAVTNIKPSVTRSELDHYEALGEEFNDLVP